MVTAAALAAVVLTSARPASATTDTLARGAMNLVGTPIDLALFPVTATTSFVRKFYMSDKHSAVGKIVQTPLIGTVYGISCVAITGATAFMRLADGLLNIPLGLAVIGADKDPDTQIYEPLHGSPGALVDYKGVYIGGYHCEGFFQ
jgi:hypothetical protein